MNVHTLLIDKIVEVLQDRIIRGDYPVGVKLSENKISDEFDCSRTPVREAFKILEQRNIVEVIPHSGTYVKELSPKENREVTEIRAALEPLAFRLACENRASTAVLRTLQEQMETVLASGGTDFMIYGRCHVLFHRHLVELSGSELLLDTYRKLNLNAARKLIYEKMNPEEIRMTNEEHWKIIGFLEDGNVEEGCAFVFNHLWQKRERLVAAENAK